MSFISLKGKKVLVMGLGLFGGGVGVTKFLVRQGAKVTVTDLRAGKELTEPLKELVRFRNITLHLGGHQESDFRKADLIIVNPAVPSDSPYLAIAEKHHITLDTEMNLFFKLCPCRIIGVTGSNGKTTATALLGEILKSACLFSHSVFRKIWVGGNIGRGSLLEMIDKISKKDIVILELSSFQLDDLARIEKSPWMSIGLNIKPNHLDRHKTMENYINAKKNIIRYQTADSYAILNIDDPEVRSWVRDCPGKVVFFSRQKGLHQGGFLKDNKFYFSPGKEETQTICHTSEIHLLGDFNYENIIAAITAGGILGVSPNITAEAIRSFKGVEHRLEFVRELKGIKYYNDSIATNPESTIAALHSIPGRIILIAGGYDKQLPFDNLAREVKQRVKTVILIGATAEKIKASLVKVRMKKRNMLIVSSFAQVIQYVNQNSQKGDTVLLSPACASYDMFRNFTERGNLFKKLVNELG